MPMWSSQVGGLGTNPSLKRKEKKRKERKINKKTPEEKEEEERIKPKAVHRRNLRRMLNTSCYVLLLDKENKKDIRETDLLLSTLMGALISLSSIL